VFCVLSLIPEVGVILSPTSSVNFGYGRTECHALAALVFMYRNLKRTAAAAFGAAIPYVKKYGPYAYKGYRVIQQVRGRPGTTGISTRRMRLTLNRSAPANPVATKFDNGSNSRSSTKLAYRKKKRSRGSGLRYKRAKRFRKKVQKALSAPTPMSVLIEQQGIASPLEINNQDDNHGDTLAGSALSDGFQLHCGFSHSWGVNVGPEFQDGTAGDVENYEIAVQSARMGRGVISGANTATTVELDNLLPYNDAAVHHEKFYIKQKLLKMTVHNTRTPSLNNVDPDNDIVANDLIFDLYEFVAAQDIKDVDFKTPCNAWAAYASGGVQAMNSSSTTGAGTNLLDYYKGLTPLDFAGVGKWWKMVKKERCIIPYNSTEGTDPYQVFQMHGKRYVHDPEKWRNLYAKKGITKFWVMVISPDQSDNTYTTPTSGAASPVCNLYFQRITHYKPIVGAGTIHDHAPPNSTRLIIAPVI